jgi:ABC-type transporter Mla subunit MlaD
MDRRPRHQSVCTVETAARPAAAVRSPAPDHVLAAVVFAVASHRRRIARLLEQLDDLQRQTADGRVGALEAGMLDAATLLAQLAARLRAGDQVLRDVVAGLQGRFD